MSVTKRHVPVCTFQRGFYLFQQVIWIAVTLYTIAAHSVGAGEGERAVIQLEMSQEWRRFKYQINQKFKSVLHVLIFPNTLFEARAKIDINNCKMLHKPRELVLLGVFVCCLTLSEGRSFRETNLLLRGPAAAEKSSVRDKRDAEDGKPNIQWVQFCAVLSVIALSFKIFYFSSEKS